MWDYSGVRMTSSTSPSKRNQKRREQALEILKPKTTEDFIRMKSQEMCTCNHFHMEHRGLEGHGKCMYGGMTIFCSCEKFTWNGKWSC